MNYFIRAKKNRLKIIIQTEQFEIFMKKDSLYFHGNCLAIFHSKILALFHRDTLGFRANLLTLNYSKGKTFHCFWDLDTILRENVSNVLMKYSRNINEILRSMRGRINIFQIRLDIIFHILHKSRNWITTNGDLCKWIFSSQKWKIWQITIPYNRNYGNFELKARQHIVIK